jgi:hypothetical protein
MPLMPLGATNGPDQERGEIVFLIRKSAALENSCDNS